MRKTSEKGDLWDLCRQDLRKLEIKRMSPTQGCGPWQTYVQRRGYHMGVLWTSRFAVGPGGAWSSKAPGCSQPFPLPLIYCVSNVIFFSCSELSKVREHCFLGPGWLPHPSVQLLDYPVCLALYTLDMDIPQGFLWSLVAHRMLAVKDRAFPWDVFSTSPGAALHSSSLLWWWHINTWDKFQVSLGVPGRYWYEQLWWFL